MLTGTAAAEAKKQHTWQQWQTSKVDRARGVEVGFYFAIQFFLTALFAFPSACPFSAACLRLAVFCVFGRLVGIAQLSYHMCELCPLAPAFAGKVVVCPLAFSQSLVSPACYLPAICLLSACCCFL